MASVRTVCAFENRRVEELEAFTNSQITLLQGLLAEHLLAMGGRLDIAGGAAGVVLNKCAPPAR